MRKQNLHKTYGRIAYLLLWQSVLDLAWFFKLDKERLLGVWAKNASPGPVVASDPTPLEGGFWDD